MEKISQELINDYRNIEGQIEEQGENIANLEEKLKVAQSELNQTIASLEKAEKEAKNNNLTTVKDIENVRKNIQYCKYGIEDHGQVTENLKRVIKNAGNCVRDLNSKKGVIQNRIWRNYIEMLSDEIRNILGERMYEYWCATTFAIPGAIGICNFGQPEEMNKFINRKDDLKKYKDKLFDKIINNGTQ